MTENQRLVWVLSMPVCASINETMQKFSGVAYETSDQHKDVSAARQARAVSDTVDLIDYLNERDPFVQNDSLFNIANDMTAQERVNVEKAIEIGVNIVESMAGKSTDEFTFRKANKSHHVRVAVNCEDQRSTCEYRSTVAISETANC